MKPKKMFPAWKLAELHTVVMYGKEKRLISLLCTLPGEQIWDTEWPPSEGGKEQYFYKSLIWKDALLQYISQRVHFQVHFSVKGKEFLQQDKS